MWTSSKPLSAGVIVWMALSVLIGPLVVVALGYLVGAIPDAVNAGLGSPAGHRLIATLIVAAVIYTVSLLTDPAGGALGTVVRQRTTGWLQARLMGAVTGPAGMTHLEPVPANAPRQRHSGNPLPADPGPRAIPHTAPYGRDRTRCRESRRCPASARLWPPSPQRGAGPRPVPDGLFLTRPGLLAPCARATTGS